MASDAGILLSELRHVIDDLQRRVGCPVTDARVPTPTSVALELGAAGWLYLESWPAPRLHTVRRPPRNPRTPYSFQGLLRARLKGTLTRIAVCGNDRIVEIDIGDHTLHARLLGRGGGIWMLQGDRVLAASDGPAPASLPEMPDGAPEGSPPRFMPQEGESWDEAAARVLGAWARDAALDALRTHVRRAVGARIKRARRLCERLEEDLARTDRVDRLRKEADALAGALHAIPRGAEHIALPDPDDPDQTLAITLDPSQSAVDAMQKRYGTARRLQAAREDIEARWLAAVDEVERLEATRQGLDAADGPSLRALVVEHGLPDPNQERANERPRAPWSTWVGPRGQTVLIGRSAQGNHALTVHHARGRDWWLHLRDVPGAHAVLPQAHRGDAPPLEDLLAAARLLMRDARLGEGATQDVQYARVADVHPIKGAGPGQVRVTNERVLHVSREPGDLDGWHRDDAS